MITIELPCRIHSDLSWVEPKQKALLALERGEKIFWHFDLGLSDPYFPLEDELIFQSLSLALKHFTKEFWPAFEKITEGACFYQGSADFSSYFVWSEKQQMNWAEWKEKRPQGKEKHLLRLFCADAFSFYFQMLTHSLPDELPVTLILDGEGCGTLAETLQLVSKERFEYFLIELRGMPVSEKPSIALCFPPEAQCDEKILSTLDEMLLLLEQPIRVAAEPFLTEQWEGVEYLYVLSDALTQMGKRKLIGFCAAGGTVIVEGTPIGLSQEIGIEEIRGRGIRTPGLLVPNQSR